MSTTTDLLVVTTVNPATGKTLAEYASFTADQVENALAQAAEAAVTWGGVPVEVRADFLRRVGALLTDRRDRYAALITAEMGKPFAEALAEIDKCAWNCAVVADSLLLLARSSSVSASESASSATVS